MRCFHIRRIRCHGQPLTCISEADLSVFCLIFLTDIFVPIAEVYMHLIRHCCVYFVKGPMRCRSVWCVRCGVSSHPISCAASASQKQCSTWTGGRIITANKQTGHTGEGAVNEWQIKIRAENDGTTVIKNIWSGNLLNKKVMGRVYAVNLQNIRPLERVLLKADRTVWMTTDHDNYDCQALISSHDNSLLGHYDCTAWLHRWVWLWCMPLTVCICIAKRNRLEDQIEISVK